MNTLKDRIIGIIRDTGPMDVGTYMNICLHDPAGGYYHTQPGLGLDFITAPEISQIFGELLGLWAAHEWQQMGSPQDINLIETGPGRGTLIIDALRAAANIPGFAAAINLYLIEHSPILKTLLRDRLARHEPTFLPDLHSAPSGQPFIILGNEWLDCLPARQFVNAGKTWHERQIGVTTDGELVFGLARENATSQIAIPAMPGTIVEIQPGLETLVMTMKALFEKAPGRALFLDYGCAIGDGPPGDTLRAYDKGRQIDPLIAPGKSDLSVDVDFARLRQLAAAAGLNVHGPISQKQFLNTLGIQERFECLARAKPAYREQLRAAMHRLINPDDMGQRFKVIAIADQESMNIAGFETRSS